MKSGAASWLALETRQNRIEAARATKSLALSAKTKRGKF
jgi:hypothetical protein